MNNIILSFWKWYQRNLALNTAIAAFLFLLQLFHLYWLFTDVVLTRLTGESYFWLDAFWGKFSIFFDYTEVPAIITTSLLYIHQLRQGFNGKALFFLLLLNTQWLHILWITDEYVVTQFSGADLVVWSAALAWVAILIDFLELPVIYDTTRQAIAEIRKGRVPNPEG